MIRGCQLLILGAVLASAYSAQAAFLGPVSELTTPEKKVEAAAQTEAPPAPTAEVKPALPPPSPAAPTTAPPESVPVAAPLVPASPEAASTPAADSPAPVVIPEQPSAEPAPVVPSPEPMPAPAPPATPAPEPAPVKEEPAPEPPPPQPSPSPPPLTPPASPPVPPMPSPVASPAPEASPTTPAPENTAPLGHEAEVPLELSPLPPKLPEVLPPWHVGTSACLRPNYMSNAELRQGLRESLSKSDSEEIASIVVNGVTLENVPRGWAEAFRKLTTSRDPAHYPPPKLAVPADCRQFECALAAVFGEKLGLRLAYMLLRYGFNGSHLAGLPAPQPGDAAETARRYRLRPFLVNEIDDALMALAAAPPSFAHMAPDRPLVRVADDYPLSDPTSQAYSVITIFQTPGDRRDRQSTLLHELAHVYSEVTWGQVYDKQEWLRISNWQLKDSWRARNGRCLLTRYGNTDPEEDFAESVTYYRYAPQALRDACPAKYDFLKRQVFKGIEYTQESLCGGAEERAAEDPGQVQNLKCARNSKGQYALQRAQGQALGDGGFANAAACWAALRTAREGIVCAPFSYGVLPTRIDSGARLGQGIPDEGSWCRAALALARDGKLCWRAKGTGVAGLVSLSNGALLQAMPAAQCYEKQLTGGATRP